VIQVGDAQRNGEQDYRQDYQQDCLFPRKITGFERITPSSA
jgi:hypothetical protein